MKSGYALITQAVVQAMDASGLVAGMLEHEESYERFGTVSVRIWDLEGAWQRARAARRAAENAWVVESVETSAPPWITWDVATDAGQKRVYSDMISVNRVDGGEGPVGVGSKYHCYHQIGEVTFTITAWDPPHHFSSDEIALGIPIAFTMQFVPSGEGTQINILCQEPQQGDPEELESLFREAARDALRRLAGILEKERA